MDSGADVFADSRVGVSMHVRLFACARAMHLQECVVVLGWSLLNPKTANLNLNLRNTEEEH